MSDFSPYTAQEFANWLSQGIIETPPENIYVTLFDTAGNELDGDFPSLRFETDAGVDWDSPGTDFENATIIDSGEALVDVDDIEDVALYDAETDGNELARYTLDDAPFNVSEGTKIVFEAGELEFDVLDNTQ